MKRFSSFGQEIYQDDCLTVLKEMESKSVDVSITSIPYNLGIKYNTYKDNKKREDYLSWIDEVFSELQRVLKDNGSLFLNVGSSNRDPWIAMDVAITLRRSKSPWVLQNDIVWAKSINIDEDQAFGHFKPINSNRYINHLHERIFHFTKTGDVKIDRTAPGVGVHYTDKSNIKRWAKKADVRCRGNVWFIPYETINTKKQKGEHPAIFPERLVEMCIKLHGIKPGLVVFDPFLGTGTALVVAKKLGLRGIGIDIDKKYIDYAIKRLSEI